MEQGGQSLDHYLLDPSVQDNASGMTLSHTHRTQARSLKSWSLFRACQDNEGDCHYNSILQMRKLRPRQAKCFACGHTGSMRQTKILSQAV